MPPKATKKKKAAPKSTPFGRRLLAAMKEMATPEVARAVLAGKAPPGASYTVTRVRLPFAAPPLTPAAVAAIRADLGLTQTTFAAFLGVTPQTVQAWEQGRNPLSGMALRFLAEVRADMPYWKGRIAAAAAG